MPIANQTAEEVLIANKKTEELPSIYKKAEEMPLISKKAEEMPLISKKAEEMPLISKKAEEMPLISKKAEEMPLISKKAEEMPLISKKTEEMDFAGQKVEDILQRSNGLSNLNGKAASDTNSDGEKGERKDEEDEGEGRKDEEGEGKRKTSEEELRMFNKTVPEERSTVKKDKVEEHFDRMPWVLGAASRVLNLGIQYGPQFAPVNISLRRRQQTFAVLFWMSTFLFMGAGSLFFLLYLFFYTQYWWVSLCYLTWFLGDRSVCNRGGRRFEWMRRWTLWRHYRDFFPAHLIKTAELDPSKNYIMGYHPHGILSAGAFCHFATEGSHFSKTYPGFTPHLLTLEGHFQMPFYREFFMATGAVSATRESMDYLLGQEGGGRALGLVVGGARESLDCHPGTVILHLSKRKGFCKMALRHGASLVPMFSFGENEVYEQVQNPPGSIVRTIQDALQRVIGLAPCLFVGRGVFQYSFGIVPFRKPIYTVVGAPIDVPLIKNPTKEQIVGLHEAYVKAIKELYNKYKHKYSEYPDCDIKIV